MFVSYDKVVCEKHKDLPHVAGCVKASRRLIRKGCLRRLRMQTSRSTRLACSGLLNTSGMRFRATYSTAAVADTGMDAVYGVPEAVKPFSTGYLLKAAEHIRCLLQGHTHLTKTEADDVIGFGAA